MRTSVVMGRILRFSSSSGSLRENTLLQAQYQRFDLTRSELGDNEIEGNYVAECWLRLGQPLESGLAITVEKIDCMDQHAGCAIRIFHWINLTSSIAPYGATVNVDNKM